MSTDARDDGDSYEHRSVLHAYRRIGKAAERGAGVRLSAAEVEAIWNFDFAIREAVDAADANDSRADPPST